MRIGIFGGTFDPIHKGHLAIAQAAKDQLELDEVIFIPAGRNPLKRHRSEVSARNRLEMVRLATADTPGFSVSDLEISRGGASFTIDTLNELMTVCPGEYYVIMGADALRSFPMWKSYERIIKFAQLAAAARPGQDTDIVQATLPPEVVDRLTWLQLPQSEISASNIRDELARGRATSLWVPQKVLQYIERHKLYTS